MQRRRAVALGVLCTLVAGAAYLGGVGDIGRSSGAAASPQRAAAPLRPQLPGGGRTLFPDRRVVAFVGNPGDRRLGALGVGTSRKMLRRLARQARPYDRKTRPVLPALELITSVATSAPGARGDHVLRTHASTIDRYLRLARRAGALLVLDVQPGQATFPAELQRLRRWLKEPDVGLALDPEWRMRPGQAPGQVLGSVDASEVNATSLELARIVRRYDLPQKLFVVHQFTEGMIGNPALVIRRPGLATVFNVDGIGTAGDKAGKYRSLAENKPGFRHGFKLFYHEDPKLMKVRSVMALEPRPDLVVYE